MLFSKIIYVLTFLIIVKASDDISFKNVFVEWSSGAEKQSTKIVSSNSLKENIPEGVSAIKISGSVPILHENAITDIKGLSILTLDGLGLEEIKPGAFKHLTTNVLSLSGNKLKKIPKGVFEDVSVAVLQLYNSGLQLIESDVFLNVHNLRTLSLSNNKLEEINPQAFNNPNIEFLDLQFNSISSLRPGDLKNLPNLRTFHLTANKLKEVVQDIFNNLIIEDLRLNYNEISKIESKAFDDMPNLSILHIDHNKLSDWDNNWLHNCPKIFYVIAGFNQIEEIPEKAFKNYPKVYSIDLQHNKIKTISPDAMIMSKSVVNFNLKDNEIEHWNENILRNVSISTLYLNNNKLKCIDGDLKMVFRTVYSSVHLHGNPWDDDCPTKTDYIDRPGPPPQLEKI